MTRSPSSSSRSGATPADIARLERDMAPVRLHHRVTGLVGTPLSASLLGDRIQRRNQELRAALPVRGVVERAEAAVVPYASWTSGFSPERPMALTGGATPPVHDLDRSTSKGGGPSGKRIN